MQRFQDPTKAIRVTPGETFAVALAGNPTTGYTWQVGVDQQHLELFDQTFEPAGEGVGAGGQEVFHLRARMAGQTGIACELRRPWDREARDTTRFQVVIE
jgi:predicted secreted protein